MRAALVLLTAFAASVAAAPVPISPVSPIEAPEPLMVREASEGATPTDLDNIKRQILEKLDAIIEARTISLGVKRQPVQLGTEVEDGGVGGRLVTIDNAADKRGFDSSRSADGPLNTAEKRGYDSSRSADGPRDTAEKRGFDSSRSADGLRDTAEKRGFDSSRSADGPLNTAEKRGFDSSRSADGPRGIEE